MPAEGDLTWIASVDDAQSERIVLTAEIPPAAATETTSTVDDVKEGRWDCDC